MFKLEYSNFVLQNVAAVHNFKPKLDCRRKESHPIIQSLSITSNIVSVLYDKLPRGDDMWRTKTRVLKAIVACDGGNDYAIPRSNTD